MNKLYNWFMVQHKDINFFKAYENIDKQFTYNLDVISITNFSHGRWYNENHQYAISINGVTYEPTLIETILDFNNAYVRLSDNGEEIALYGVLDIKEIQIQKL